MASNKLYGYYLRGKQIALIQEDKDDGQRYKSPVEAITDGLEIEYAYSPRYSIVERGTFVECESFGATDGFLKIIDSNAGLPTSGITHVVIEGSEKFNGLHKIKTFTSNTTIVLDIPYNGGTLTEGFTVFTDVNALDTEDDTIDLPEYLTKALVYYVKAKVAEDRMDIDAKEYFLREFRKMIEKQESSKVWGVRQISSSPSAIK